VEAELVQVEVNAGEMGEPRLILVGLPDAAVKESDDRVFSALSNAGFRPPRTRTTINLAPGHLRKEGPIYDLPIALGILVATGQLRAERLEDYLIVGELSLSGETRPVRGALAMARLAQRLGKRGLLLPPISAEEGALVEAVPVYRVDSLATAAGFLAGGLRLEPVAPRRFSAENRPAAAQPGIDFAEVKGQAALRRAVEVAVAGAHNLLIIGSPGSGKSMVARRIPTIMPPPTAEERLEILGIQSAAGHTLTGDGAFQQRPFRSPHHRTTDIALIGGGAVPRPGEISLAHCGVLFLDELPEFRRSVLEVLRQPLEDGEIVITRNAAQRTLPCAFMLVAAMNPCPCGQLGETKPACRCTPAQVQRYQARVSGPLLDRIDLQVQAPALPLAEMRAKAGGETSAVMRARVEAARRRQAIRFAGAANRTNARMSLGDVRRHCALDDRLADLLQHAMERLALSARAYDRILKVARTIADLDGAESIGAAHLLEAIQYRGLDRAPGE
jgi:magnesium chelatase family protein